MGWLRGGFAVAMVGVAFACSNGDANEPADDCVDSDGSICKNGASCAPSHCASCTCLRGTIECEATGLGSGSCDPGSDAGNAARDANPPLPPNGIVVGVDAKKLVVDATFLYWLDSGGAVFRMPKTGGTVERIEAPLAADFTPIDGGFALLALDSPYPPYLVRTNDHDGGFESFPYPDDLSATSGALRPSLTVLDDRAIVATENGGVGVFAFADGGWSAATIADGGGTRILGENATEIATVVAGSPSELVVVDRATLAPIRTVSLDRAQAFAFDDSGATIVSDGIANEEAFDGGIERIDSDCAASPFRVPANPAAMTSDDTFLYSVGWNLNAVRKDDGGAQRLDGDGGAYASFFPAMLVTADDESVFVYASDGANGAIYRFAKPSP